MLIINKSKCVACGSCVAECHRRALSLVDGELSWDGEKCYGCGHCMALCPRESLMLDGDGYDVTEVEEFNIASRPKEGQVREMIMMRRSLRNFTDNEVSDEDLEKILEAGKYAPTAENKQGNMFLVVRSEEKRREMLEDSFVILRKIADDILNDKRNDFSKTAANNMIRMADEFEAEGIDGLFHGAPLFVYVFSDTIQNGAIAACTMGNMAYGLRLGFCYIGIGAAVFEDKALREKYNIPEGKYPAMALAIGEPEPEFFCSVPRKTPETIIL